MPYTYPHSSSLTVYHNNVTLLYTQMWSVHRVHGRSDGYTVGAYMHCSLIIPIYTCMYMFVHIRICM